MLANYKLANVYLDVPDDGFPEDKKKPEDPNVADYFKMLFKTLGAKLD